MPTSPTELAHKLGIRSGMVVAVLGGPAGVSEAIRQGTPPGIRCRRSLGAGQFDLIFFWPTKAAGLRRDFARLQAALLPDGAVWAVLPKKAHAAARGVSLTWEEMQAEGLHGDLVDNKVATISDTDYGTRFVIRKARRGRRRPAAGRR